MTKKFSSIQAYTILKDYLAIRDGTHSTFNHVTDLLLARKISRNVPSKLLSKFHKLWKDLHPNEDIDYKLNVFLEREKLRKHRSLPEDKGYNEFVGIYARGGYQTYETWCQQKGQKITIKEGRYYYYKQAMKDKTGSKPQSKKHSDWRITAKEWYNLLYKKYDLVVHIDGKSMENQENIWKNADIKNEAKWLSLAVEAKSGVIAGIWIEKSHNKTNAGKIFKQIVEHVEYTLGKDKKICFITDAGSEYVNKKDLRGMDITDKDTSKLAGYLRDKGHGRRITRRPEDNSFVENKNDYIERACLDNKEIQVCDYYGFMCLLEEFVERNNIYLKGSKKAFRGKRVTPQENIIERFGDRGIDRTIGIHVQAIERIHRISHKHKTTTIPSVLKKLHGSVKILKRSSKRAISYVFGSMHPKSLDSSQVFLNLSFFIVSFLLGCF